MKQKLEKKKNTHNHNCEECGRNVMSIYKTIKGKLAVWLCWACFNDEDE